MNDNKTYCTKKVVFLITVLTTMVVSIFLIALLVAFSSPSLMNNFFENNAFSLLNPTSLESDRLLTLFRKSDADLDSLSLKDIWAFQSSLYQTIITFLIAINGLIAAVSVLYIRGNSEEKAEETTKKYMESKHFDVSLAEKVNLASEATFINAQKDFESSADRLYRALETLSRLESENRDIKQQLRVVSERVAYLDEDDSEGKQERLKRGNK
ncbi:MAG: hypothetical protein KA748_03960 [Halomonas sp.]|nr:hypothetical protein [Halomonas sp.]MBP5979340.1 hypothetical protein [Halomonas sp.]